MGPVYLLCLVLFSHPLLILSAGHDGNDELEDSNCPRPFTCGTIGSFQFPFTKAELPHCGLIPIYGCDNDTFYPKKIKLDNYGNKSVQLSNFVKPNKIISVFDEDFHSSLEQNACVALNKSYSLPSHSPLVSFYIEYNVSLFRCNNQHHRITPPPHYGQLNCSGYDIYYDKISTILSKEDATTTFSACSIVQFSTKDVTSTSQILSFVSAAMVVGVVLSDECDECYNHRGGLCRLGNDKSVHCDKAKHGKRGKMVHIIITIAASSVAVALLLLLACCIRMKLFTLTYDGLVGNKDLPTDETIIELFLEQHGPLPTRRYSYSELKKFTNDFKVKLGEGGYGSVYKGKLQDGRLVAIKVLSELKGTVEEFINEVASISRTSHVNIVTLVGFCFQGSKRALIYEFMPNGSLEKFIYEEGSAKAGRQLDCKILYDIVIGVARGLDYLHRGCSTKILHFDIKPHNILLDEDFCPKISDFGLAKICPRKESMVSMMCARGTIGYIAPEVFSRNFGGVSHKADVYSYGMMILEMVGGKHNKNVLVDCSSDLYFPHWIYRRLEQDQDFGLLCIKNVSDRETIRKMIVVSLWCIQSDPSTRPSMNKVVEMLEGSSGSLTLPPKPFLNSAPESPTHYSSLTSETL